MSIEDTMLFIWIINELGSKVTLDPDSEEGRVQIRLIQSIEDHGWW